ncbi:hypothetical protein M0E87_08220 [Corynebacterium sp. CCM 9185]|uniref:Uncharacterized protein n=1 Tax=Corynebacterium marambiense TaxID=2765364 RepID=A0ABS0VVH4_9CORY|nr:hypothetical protein [Corynebacterium marambiense]MBI9000289.1 hypothetical protein [Corynebacterium marambiense]MCK7663644.1 hypothetical protein [Corynebacterium marambiense]MCX7541922.1 hypothetical protein [Corynebacterium marambiense]
MFSYPFEHFLWITFIFAAVPSAVWGGILAVLAWRFPDDRSASGPGLWLTGLIGFVFGVLAAVGWLSWSADDHGGITAPGFPPPTNFPSWQIAACALTVGIFWFLAARLSSWRKLGGFSAAIGVTAGLVTAFCIAAATDTTGQSGVGALFLGAGASVSLAFCAGIRATFLGRSRDTSA